MDSNQAIKPEPFIPMTSGIPTAGVLDASLLARKAFLEHNILSIQEGIRKATGILENLVQQLQEVDRQLAASRTTAPGTPTSVLPPGCTDFASGTFRWSQNLLSELYKAFGITQFRRGQEGVCNANLAGRDVVCVMPTGAGKSLTYQLPAIVSKGCTLVISPLRSLMADQILHLREYGIEACSLTGHTSEAEKDSISRRLCSSYGTTHDIKLCYVTPEKIVMSDAFRDILGRMVSAGTLDRIVIDEAHCISQMGHDFRPDYGKLYLLRELFPKVPIFAVSATMPSGVLKDVIKTLRLPPLTHGRAATLEGTVFFSAPLYRQNLHYKVIAKGSAATTIRDMVDYIVTQPAGASGIIYCSSKKDVIKIAKELTVNSNGKIRTGIYHRDVPEEDKTRVHNAWRKGEIDVIVATVAFGMGIDKPDVRFVMHHNMPQSLEAFYQESGRAGRDGRDADCILYYKHQDAMRIFGLIHKERQKKRVPQERAKLYAMLNFAMDRVECRKVTFAKYFMAPAEVSREEWESEASTPCRHCDNCVRPPGSVVNRDVSVEAWKICKIAEAMALQHGRVTLTTLADVARGKGNGSFKVVNQYGKPATTGKLNLDTLCGGKICLEQDDAESLVVKLILSGHLVENCHKSKHSEIHNVYIKPGPQSASLARHSLESVDAGNPDSFHMTLLTLKPPPAAPKRQAREMASGSTSELPLDTSSDGEVSVASLAGGSSPGANLWEVDYDSDGGVDVDFSSDEAGEMEWNDEDPNSDPTVDEDEEEVRTGREDSSGYSYDSGSDSEWEPPNTPKRARGWAVPIHRASTSREGGRAREATSSDEEAVPLKRRKIGQAIAVHAAPRRDDDVMSSD